MPAIEFFYYADCPSHEQALSLLQTILSEEKLLAPVKVIEIKNEFEAQQYTFYGSPTIRINGIDIAPIPEELTQPGLTCRAYQHADGRITPLPPRDLVVAALHRHAVV